MRAMEKREHWSGRAGFILATIGSAVGLGSIWKFPYEVGTNGGGAFVFFYLVGLVLIVLPLMLVEFAIGRRGKSDASHSIAVVAQLAGSSRAWSWVGVLGVVTAFLILSFYSVIGGWALAYVLETVRNGLPGADARAAQGRFDALLASPVQMAAYHAAFMAATALVVSRGILNGIESAAKILMPILIALIVVLSLYSMIEGDVGASFRFLFALDGKHLTAKVALEALGLGFFSIGVGLAVMVTFAAYAGPDINLRRWRSSPCWAIPRSRSSRALRSFRSCLPISWTHRAGRAWCSSRCRWRSPACRWASSRPRLFSCCWSWRRSHPRSRCSKCRWRYCVAAWRGGGR